MALTIERICAMNLHYRYVSWKTFLESVSGEGLSAVELWGGSPHLHWEDMEPGAPAKLRGELRERGLELVCYTPEQCMYPVNIASEIEPLRGRSVDFFRRNIDICAELECPLMLITSGTGYFNEAPEEAWKRSAQSLDELTRHAAARGISLGLEVLRPDESTLVHNAATLRKMVEEIGSDALGAVLDINPMGVNGERLADYFDALGDRLWHIHFIDGTPYGHLAWGDGGLNPEELLSQLRDEGYDGYLTLEITDSRYILDPGDAVRRSMERLRRAFAAIYSDCGE